jgi:hypothetical protein
MFEINERKRTFRRKIEKNFNIWNKKEITNETIRIERKLRNISCNSMEIF